MVASGNQIEIDLDDWEWKTELLKIIGDKHKIEGSTVCG